MCIANRRLAAGVIAAAVLTILPGVGARSQAVAGDGGEVDCVIEPKWIANVGRTDEGVISAIHVERGDIVRAGQKLATLDSRIESLTVELTQLRAEQDVKVKLWRARHRYQQLETERVETLFRKKIASRKTLQQAALDEVVAELEVRAAEIERRTAEVEHRLAKARLERRTIRSPVDGVITEVKMAPGEYVHEQSPILTIAQIEELNVEAFLPVSRYGQVAVGQMATVRPVRPVGGAYDAEVVVVDRVLDAASGTFGVRLRLPNRDLTLPAGIKCTASFAPGRTVKADAAPGNGASRAAPPAATGEAPRAELVRRIQTGLRRAGFDPGPADGTMGARTRAAISDYKEKQGLGDEDLSSTDLLGHLENHSSGTKMKEIMRQPGAVPAPRQGSGD